MLITGGAGFVGSYLCEMFKKEGYFVTSIDDLSNGRIENIKEGFEFIKVDITNPDLFNKLKHHNFDLVIHCAAQSSNARSFIDPKQDMITNQFGTLNILDFCIKKNIKRFIFTSSMSAYGEPKNLPTKETNICFPDSFYAVHKLSSEYYIRIYAQQHGLKYTIFRLYTTYGHGQNLENREQGLLSIYLSYIVNKETLAVKGSKDRLRDIIHVSDVASAIRLSLNNPKSYRKIYNLGTGRAIKIKKIIELLTLGMGYKKGAYPVRYEGSTPGDPFKTQADIKAAVRDLKWMPKISAEEGIKLTLEGYRK
jgi:UDP-glucose 4-epimerase